MPYPSLTNAIADAVSWPRPASYPPYPAALLRPTIPAICPHYGCRFRPGAGPFAILNTLTPRQRFIALTRAGFLRASRTIELPERPGVKITTDAGCSLRVRWLGVMLGCSVQSMHSLFAEARAFASGFPSVVPPFRQRWPEGGRSGREGGGSEIFPREPHLDGYRLSNPAFPDALGFDPSAPTCRICGRPCTLHQAMAPSYPPSAEDPATRLLAVMKRLPVSSTSILPLAWLAQYAGVSTHVAARILKGAGFTIGQGYCAELRNGVKGVRGYKLPQGEVQP